MQEMYRSFMEEVLALPVIVGEKSAGERFPGAVATYTLEAMMQDRKAIQAGTSHYLGQNFAKASGIKFTNRQGVVEYGYTTSWGVTTRLIGSVVMCHGDDDGLRLPPRIAPKQIVIIPIIPKPDQESAILAYAEELACELRQQSYGGRPVTVFVDKREKRGGEKTWEWIKKGVPIRIEIGPKDVASNVVTVARRDRDAKVKETLPLAALRTQAVTLLEEIQDSYLQQARTFQQQHIHTDLQDFAALESFFMAPEGTSVTNSGGFVRAKWCGDAETEALLEPLKVSIRCLPHDQNNTPGRCILTGRPATLEAIFAKSY
jgi:prolyl-tRNA synthetase